MDQAKSKKLIIVAFSVLAAIIIGLVTTLIVLAANSQSIQSAINVSYTAKGVYGTATATYKVGASGTTTAMKTASNKTEIKFENGVVGESALNPENISLTETDSYVVFAYTFTNVSPRIYYANLTYTDLNADDKNTKTTYSNNGTDYAEEYKYVTVPADGNATIYIKVAVANLARDAVFTGSYNWELSEEIPAISAEDAEVTFTSYNESAKAVEVSGLKDSSAISVDIPEAVKYNGEVYTVTKIGDNAFDGRSSLTSVTIPSSVTSIGTYAFRSCSSLTSVTFPNSVTSLGEGIFMACSNLTSVTLPNNIKSIGNNMFSGCSKLTSVTIPSSVTSIGYNAFYECSKLTSLTIPSSVKSIGSSAFYGCSGLTGALTIPSSVTSIDREVFRSCSNLSSITISSGVTSISESAFAGCSGLTSLTIPNSVKSIGGSAFLGCSKLTSVTIPSSVTSIGNNAFAYSDELTSVTIEGNTLKSGGSYVFSGCSNLTNIYVNANLVEQYKTATNWSNYATKISAIPA